MSQNHDKRSAAVHIFFGNLPANAINCDLCHQKFPIAATNRKFRPSRPLLSANFLRKRSAHLTYFSVAHSARRCEIAVSKMRGRMSGTRKRPQCERITANNAQHFVE
jgi:hypothetical protein